MRTAVLVTLTRRLAGALLIALLPGAPLAAAATAPLTRQAPQDPPERLFLDSIVASVNDSAILQSRLFSTTLGAIPGTEAEIGRRLTNDEIRQLTMRDLRDLIGDYQMAQSARSFGNFPPERFDMILESELKRDQEDLRRDLGGYGAVSDELERRGETWQTYAKSQRVEKMQMLAESFAIYERLRKQQNLYLTPRMLRETYEEFRHEFERDAAAEVAMVVFVGADAEQQAGEAAAFWRTGDWTARQVADRYPGATATQAVAAGPLPEALKQFALAGPIGNVSPPMPRGNGFVVLKIMRYRPAAEGRFSDPEVQARVRDIAQRKVIFEFRMQALERARQRTEVWIYERGQRIPLQGR